MKLTSSTWKKSMKRLLILRNSSDIFHLSPLKTRHGLLKIPIFSFLKSFKPWNCFTPNSIMSRIWLSWTRPMMTLSGRFFECEPNMNRWQSFLIRRLSSWLWSSNGVMSLFRVSALQWGFLNVHKSFRMSLMLAEVFRPSRNKQFLTFSITFGSNSRSAFFPFRVFGFLQWNQKLILFQAMADELITYWIRKRDVFIVFLSAECY